jgi:hypothetical protein
MAYSESATALINSIVEQLHRIRVWLYPNHLPKAKKPFIARAENEQILGVDKVAAALKNRSGYVGKVTDLVDTVEQFMAETMYQVADGYGVDLGPVTLYPIIGGEWNGPEEAGDRKAHPIRFRCRIMPRMRRMSEVITLDCMGVIPQNGQIDEVIDQASGVVNKEITIGNYVKLRGTGLRVAEPANPDEDTGVWFVDETGATTRCPLIADNGMHAVKFLVPTLADGKKYRVRIVTYSSVRDFKYLLQHERTMETAFEVTAKTKVTPVSAPKTSPVQGAENNPV